MALAPTMLQAGGDDNDGDVHGSDAPFCDEWCRLSFATMSSNLRSPVTSMIGDEGGGIKQGDVNA
jgi:hypothetical protein